VFAWVFDLAHCRNNDFLAWRDGPGLRFAPSGLQT
jgi:hypothetical protein